MLNSAVLPELDLSRPFVYLPEQQARYWKDGLERHVRQACDQLNVRRRGVHGFRATAACEFVAVKRALGFAEDEARREMAMWLEHNPHRTEVTYAYVPKSRQSHFVCPQDETRCSNVGENVNYSGCNSVQD
jgi:hypothetical protein